MPWRTLSLAALLFALNAYIIWPYASTAYLGHLYSNDLAFTSIASFYSKSNALGWFPYFDLGMPGEAAYLPLVPWLTSLVHRVLGMDHALAQHALTGFAYAITPVGLFALGLRTKRSTLAAFSGALFLSLASPTAWLFHDLRNEMQSYFGTRLYTIIVFAEVPHTIALSILPWSLCSLIAACQSGTWRACLVVAATTTALAVTNAFGIVTLLLLAIPCAVFAGGIHRQALWRLPLLAMASYAAVSPLLTPQVLLTMRAKSQYSGGFFQYGWHNAALPIALLLLGAAAWRWRVFRRSFPTFALSSLAIFLFIVGFHYWRNLSVIPQPHRYLLELEFAFGLSVALLPSAPSRMLIPVLLIAALPAQAARARMLSQPIHLPATAQYRVAEWMRDHVPLHHRVLPAAELGFLYNLVAPHTQINSGHEPSSPNPSQPIAIYTIYTGTNAGPRDAAVSLLWLQAYGVGMVAIPPPRSDYHYTQAFANPAKFEGVLPLLHQIDGWKLYQVPVADRGDFRVVPATALVTTKPIHGLDTAQLEPFVHSLRAPTAKVQAHWHSPNHASVQTQLPGGAVVHCAITYDPRWRATHNGKAVRTSQDALGLLVVHGGKFELVYNHLP